MKANDVLAERVWSPPTTFLIFGILPIHPECPAVASEVGEQCIISTARRLHRLSTSCLVREKRGSLEFLTFHLSSTSAGTGHK